MATTKKPKTRDDIELGLAELCGVAVCAGPGCTRQLKDQQGKATPKGRMCYLCFNHLTLTESMQ